jgi:multimeric flavodoxin WrbA
MKILVLGGSPKGEKSVTMQYVRFLERSFPEHAFEVVQVSQRIRRLEREEAAFADALERVRAAEVVLWATPVYYFLVPSQLKRFIELVHERGAATAFAGRHAAAVTTSIHFFDHTAHAYLAGVSEDLGMRFHGGHSAEMMDLTRPGGQRQLLGFARDFFSAAARGEEPARVHQPAPPHGIEYLPGPAAAPVDAGGSRVIVVTDRDERSPNLARMVDRLAAAFTPPADVVDLAALDIKAGCQGCLQCGFDNRCAFEGKDDLVELFRGRVMAADVVVFAGAIRDRYLSARFKAFFDRSFFRGHAPSLDGKQVAWVVAGPLRRLPYLRQIFEGYAELQGSTLAGIVADEEPDPRRTDAALDGLAARLAAWAAEGRRRPQTFLGVGGHKVLRDAVWGELRLVFQADHRCYRRTGLYDFPQRRIGLRLVNLAAPLLRLPPLRRGFFSRMNDGMLMPFRKALAAAGPPRTPDNPAARGRVGG